MLKWVVLWMMIELNAPFWVFMIWLIGLLADVLNAWVRE